MINFPTKVDKIAFSGDWHANTSYAQKAIYWAKNQGAEVILHTGDFGYQFPDSYLDALELEAKRCRMIVMFVDGNHENFSWLLAQPVSEDGVRRLRERVWHLPRGFRWEWSGVKFLALGGAHSVDKNYRVEGKSWWHQEWITIKDAYNAIEGGLVDVMVTHDCPAGVDIPNLPPDGIFPHEDIRIAAIHRQILRDIVDEVKPRFIFHGHYHVNYVDWLDNTMVYGLNRDKAEFHQNMSVWRIENLKKPLDN